MLEKIEIRGAKEHNLKNVNIDLPKNKFIVFTGLSGSGKSSLAFDTIYAEGQRRYVESLSAYARQFLQLNNKPDVESIKGLSPAIAIDQKTTSKNPRSTVGTITEIYDYLRLLYARIGIPYSPATGEPIEKQSSSQIVEKIKDLPLGTKIYILAPIINGEKGEHRKELLKLRKQGFQRVKVNDVVNELDDLPQIDKNKKNIIDLVVDRLVIEEEMGNRLADSVETGLKLSDGIIKVEILDDGKSNIQTYSERFSCPVSGFQIEEIEPRIFSFNSPFGACKICDGIGIEHYFDPNLVVPNSDKSVFEGAIVPWESTKTREQQQLLEGLAKHFKFSVHTPFKNLSTEVQNIIMYGANEKIQISMQIGLTENKTELFFPGVIKDLEKKIRDSSTSWIYDDLKKFQSTRNCKSCGGMRLRKESLCIKINGLNIGEVSALTIKRAKIWFDNLSSHLNTTQNQIGKRIIKEISQRLSFLMNVGLDYLTISRNSGTLSGGESQRIRLASQIGSGLTGVLYVLDEPSIGLHQSDNDKLIKTLKNLAELGNTVIVVEHDEETMASSEHLVDIGPGAGIHGGKIMAQGTPEEVSKVNESITGQYLSGKNFIAIPEKRLKGNGKFIELIGATSNNLKNVDIKIPLSTFTSVTGVSGSGKSSLIIHTFYKAAAKLIDGKSVAPENYEKISGLEYVDKIVDINQSPIGRTPRSNPATYTGAFNLIRDWFTALPESKARGYKSGRFSFNVKGGRCDTCQGDGVLKIEMHFLPDVYVKCDECKGRRYNNETLEIKYKDKSIADVLQMTVEDSYKFFEKIPLIRDKLKALLDVGLGYIQIGQSATTLSGGEAQRVKLAKELSRKSTGRTLYILDEPTTGLHTEDIKRLLQVLHKFVELGNTVLVIEHNMDVIKTSDYIIDVGPGGGDKGGEIVCTGTPEQIIQNKKSVTGAYLYKHLNK
ncbi:MAG: excinuclease ABC subunit UvrA [Rickettsiales bacterium]